jgi:hypothetical protein
MKTDALAGQTERHRRKRMDDRRLDQALRADFGKDKIVFAKPKISGMDPSPIRLQDGIIPGERG